MKRATLILIFILPFASISAQCAMCRAVLESEVGQATAKGVNNGIVYLMIIPYILIGGVAFFLYRYLKDSK
ncbi:hypothetical protein [Formosa sp. Hel1_33_131]|jgi:hypothetical protein|uniref:hypothetical protein n=1 Tax=Formosa sp. Hel1_33_131 TaxID=1336794 RepID=UPI00084E2D8D|nr:hypothetical protein [Formosa sp. Hel1_33_131]